MSVHRFADGRTAQHDRKCEACGRIFLYQWKPRHSGTSPVEWRCMECQKPAVDTSETVTLYKHGKAAIATGLRFRGRGRG